MRRLTRDLTASHATQARSLVRYPIPTSIVISKLIMPSRSGLPRTHDEMHRFPNVTLPLPSTTEMGGRRTVR